MMMKRSTLRLLSLLLILLTALALFSACDGEKKASESESEDKTTQENSPADEMVGTWYDPIRPRVSLTVEKRSGGGYDVTILWSDSAYQVYEWHFIGREEDGKIVSGNCQKSLRTYTAEDTFTQKVIFKNGNATLYFDEDGKLCWLDGKENAGEDCRFEKNEVLAS